MKNIYLVLTYTGTILSRVIRYYTKEEYAHVSISLDKELNEMYSFGRIFPYIAFVGGFVHESIDKGTFKRFKNTQAEICSIEVTDEQYDKLKILIHKFEVNKGIYSFNIIGLAAIAFKKRIRLKNHFYCAEFVKYALEESEIEVNLPELARPQDFGKLEKINICYKGKLNDYNIKKRKSLTLSNL